MHDLELDGLASAASLIFPTGSRPRRADVRDLAARDGQFAISLEPEPALAANANGNVTGDWIELVANGLTFDLAGLSPGGGTALPELRHRFGLPQDFASTGFEAVTLMPGPHLAGGHLMLPVLRTLAVLAARLGALADVRAIAWHAAGSWNAPALFRDHVLRWIEGGPFPGLGLAALVAAEDGGIVSEGLSLFTGQELHIMLQPGEDRSEGARIALRLMHWLVENGAIENEETLTGPSGERLRLEPSANRRLIKVWKT